MMAQWGRGIFFPISGYIRTLASLGLIGSPSYALSAYNWIAPDVESSYYSGAGVNISHSCNSFLDC